MTTRPTSFLLRAIAVFQLLLVLGIVSLRAAPLERSTPESQGVPSAAILDLIDHWESNKMGLHSYMIMRHGKVVSEGWWAPYAPELPHIVWSLSKSFTSAGIGLAIEDGLLSLDDTVISFFPEESPESPGQFLSNMRIRDLITMTTGHRDGSMNALFAAGKGSWVKAFLEKPVEDKPGTHFVYNTSATYMLSAILQKVTGEKLVDYLEPRLFVPLGIETPEWSESPEGVSFGGFGLNLKTEDIARFGQLYLQSGEWQGEQLLPVDWVAASSSKQVSNGSAPESEWDQGYGYQFWRNTREGSFRGDGAFGQFCIVSPEDDLVVAITSGENDMGDVIAPVWSILAAALSDEPLKIDKKAMKALAQKNANLARPKLVGEDYNRFVAVADGNTYVLEANALQLESVGISFGETAHTLTFETTMGSYELEIGKGDWVEGSSPLLSAAVAQFVPSIDYMGTGVWEDDDTYAVQLICHTSPTEVRIRFDFSDEAVTLRFEQNVGFGPTSFTPIKGRLEE